MDPYAMVATAVAVAFAADHIYGMILADADKPAADKLKNVEDKAKPNGMPFYPGSIVAEAVDGVSIVTVPVDGSVGTMRVWGKAYHRAHKIDASGTPVKQGTMYLRDDGVAFYSSGKEVDGGPYRVEPTSIGNGEVLYYFRPVNDNAVVITQAAMSDARRGSKRSEKS